MHPTVFCGTFVLSKALATLECHMAHEVAEVIALGVGTASEFMH